MLKRPKPAPHRGIVSMQSASLPLWGNFSLTTFLTGRVHQRVWKGHSALRMRSQQCIAILSGVIHSFWGKRRLNNLGNMRNSTVPHRHRNTRKRRKKNTNVVNLSTPSASLWHRAQPAHTSLPVNSRCSKNTFALWTRVGCFSGNRLRQCPLRGEKSAPSSSPHTGNVQGLLAD